MQIFSYALIPMSVIFFGCQEVSSQVLINEYMAANSSINQDPDYFEYSDWVELYNQGSVAVNLKGYYLTDNKGIPDKWQITTDFIIQAGSFGLIWTDGMNTGLHASFKLSADGEYIALFSPIKILQDSISFGIQKTDVSEGRSQDGSGIWGFYTQPTPGGSNSASTFYSDYAKNVPEFSIRGMIYSSPQTLELITRLGGIIRYTLDGSEPTVSSPVYINPINISTNTIVRARIFMDGMIPGPVVTNSYFLEGDLKNRKLPVVSISTNPDNLWDPQKGIYVQNFKPDWEIPANIELFENNGSDRAAFNEQVGIKINGLYSWQLPQKMLGIYFKGQYGSSNLPYHLLFHKQRSSYKDFALRASGSDWSYTMFRDVLGQDASRLNTRLDFMDFRPSIVFFNGEYMGIHNIREKVDADYIEKNYNLEPETFDLVENEEFAEAGDLTNYQYLQTILAKDLTVSANFDAVAELIDIEDFTDLVITEMAVANTSIDHNVMAWKLKEGGKWDWVIMDLDRGFFNPTSNLISFYLQQNSFPFRKLMTNDSYKNYFGQRLADQLYTSFHPERMKNLIDSHSNDIETEIPFHVEKWLGTTSSYGNAMPSVEYWYNEVCDLKMFVEIRPQALLSDLQNYGFTGTANLFLSVYPGNAGKLTINTLSIPGSVWSGPYLKNVETKISTIDKPGYNFIGWKNASRTIIIPKGSVWKYLDDGSDQGDTWTGTDYNDASWKSGPAQLGYEEGDEATLIGYGGNTSSKYITSYFRHSFNLSATQLESTGYMIGLLKDDGAVVYINGQEIIRANLACGSVNYQSRAVSTISGSSESTYASYFINGSMLVEGENIIAVEVHQDSKSSSDLSFDFELSGINSSDPSYLSKNRDLPIVLTDDLFLTAVYEVSGQCIVPEVISGEVILDEACSPYVVQGNIKVTPGSSLIIKPGVEVLMPSKGNILVEGKIEAIGTDVKRIVFKSNPESGTENWGAITFLNTTDTSKFSYVTIENASRGEVPIRDYAAISAFNGDIVLDNVIIENNGANPIVCRYSDVVLTNSSLHSDVSGDLINAKYGTARIENSIFKGSNAVDGDGIDYDGITNGSIRNSTIYNCLGINSDAVDVGESTTNLIIEGLSLINIFDKGISVGQNSSVRVINSVFSNCTLGMGIKDLSNVNIDRCTFYGNTIPIDCYEKNPGSSGGIATAINSILSNSSILSYSADSKSSLSIQYSISDNNPLPSGAGNKFGNPLFINPLLLDFGLLPGSPAILAGNEQGIPVNMGSMLEKASVKPFPVISKIYINPLNTINPEFIEIYNPSDESTDLSDYSVSKGFTFVFPKGITLGPKDYLYLTSDANSVLWFNFTKQILQWTEGKLSNSGESIELLENHNLVIDFVNYSDQGSWPATAFSHGDIMILKKPDTDNHFGENWYAESIANIFNRLDTLEFADMILYPNPSYDRVNIIAPSSTGPEVLVYSAQGKLLGRETVISSGYAEIGLAKYNQGVVFLKIGNKIRKVIVLK